MDSLVGRQLDLWTPSQNPVFLDSHYYKLCIFVYSRKQPAAVTDTIFASQGCPLTRAYMYVIKLFGKVIEFYLKKSLSRQEGAKEFNYW